MSKKGVRGRMPAAGCVALLLVALMVVMPQSGYADGIAESGPIRGAIASTQSSICLPFAIGDDVLVDESEQGDRLDLAGFNSGGKSGTPALPSCRLQFLLPPDVDYATASVILNDAVWEDVPGEIDIAPAPPAGTFVDGKAVVMWGDNEADIVGGRDMTIYGNDAPYPASPVGEVVPSKYREWNLGMVSLCPVAYNPVQKTLSLLRSATVCITFDRLAGATVGAPASAGSTMFWGKIAPGLENPGDRDAFYPPPAETSSGGFDAGTSDSGYWKTYVIITTSTILAGSSNLIPLGQHKWNLSGGANVNIVTESSTKTSGTYVTGTSCASRAANIRDWLRTYYLSQNIEYVLLIGDPHPTSWSSTLSVPMMLCYPDGSGGSYPTPTDFCYAELSDTWDKDLDGFPGEYSGDFGANGCDQTAEIAVGRIPYYGNMTDLDSILNKIIDYETTTTALSWREKILIPAAVSNFAPQDNDNNGTTDLSIEVHGDNWGQLVKLMAGAEGFSPYALYEKSGWSSSPNLCYPSTACDAPLTQANIQSEWLNKYGFVTWWAHGSSTSASRVVWANDSYISDVKCQYNSSETSWVNRVWQSSDCSALNDSYPSWVMLVSCSCGYPETTTNLGYSLLKQGAIGTVSASRISWYVIADPWTTSYLALVGDNASYGYYIPQRMIAEQETIGEALNYVKQNSGWNFSSQWVTWMNMLDFNIYGDPSGSHDWPYNDSRTCQFMTAMNSYGETSAPELARTGINYGNARVMTQVKDASTGTQLKQVFYTLDFEPVSTVAVPDFSGNGKPELACLGRRMTDGCNLAHVADASSGALIKRVYFHAEFRPFDIEVMSTFGQTSAPELVVLGRRPSDTAIMGAKRDASVRFMVNPRTWFAATFLPVDIEIMGDINANGIEELVSLQQRMSDGAIASEVRDASTNLLITRVWYDNSFSYRPMDVEVVPDFGGTTAPEVAMLRLQSNNAVAVEVKDTSSDLYVGTGTLTVLSTSISPVELEVISNFGGDSTAPELVVLGYNPTTDAVSGEVRDASTGTLINTVSFDSAYRPMGIEALTSFSGTSWPELAVHGVRPSDGAVIGEVKDASSGALLQTCTFQTVFEMP